MIKIDKGVPMPTAATAGRVKQYPFAEMDVGDSFFVATQGGDIRKTQVRIAGNASAARRANKACAGRKFATRQVEGGVRVWRTA